MKPDPRAERREHLVKFAEAFVRREHRHRWLHVLCERPEKAGPALHKFEHHFDARVCSELSSLVDRDETLLGSFGDATGVFFDGRSAARVMRLSEALANMSPFQDDALFSMEPGRSAVFFHHEGAVWICRRNTPD